MRQFSKAAEAHLKTWDITAFEVRMFVDDAAKYEWNQFTATKTEWNPFPAYDLESQANQQVAFDTLKGYNGHIKKLLDCTYIDIPFLTSKGLITAGAVIAAAFERTLHLETFLDNEAMMIFENLKEQEYKREFARQIDMKAYYPEELGMLYEVFRASKELEMDVWDTSNPSELLEIIQAAKDSCPITYDEVESWRAM